MASYKIFLSLFISMIFASACTSTKISSSWKDPGVSKTSFKNIVVVGIMEGKRKKSLRISFEEHMVNDLKEAGIKAASSSNVYGLKSFNGMSENDIIQLLKKDGYDAVITIALLDVTKEQSYVRGQVDFWPGGIYYSRFGRYYSYWYNRVYTPGYYVTNTTYLVEANLFDIERDKLIFSSQTETIDPASIDNLAHRISRSLFRSMQEKEIL
jgi:hypothetical protein